MRAHFDDDYLDLIRSETLVRPLTGVADRLGGELAVDAETPQAVRAEIAGLRIEAAAQAGPPHRLTRLRMYSLGQRVTDPRVASPASLTSGPVPAAHAAARR